MKQVKTEDGSLTLYSEEYQELYHTIAGAYSEALYKFIEPSGILRAPSGKNVLDIGFGLGYNSFVLVDKVLTNEPEAQINIFSIEKDGRVLFYKPFSKYSDYYDLLRIKGEIKINNIFLKIFIGDARIVIKNFDLKFFDYIFLDPFSPPKNPELWTVQFFRDIKRIIKDDGCVLTYSSALPVIAAFLKVGFYVGYTPDFGRKRGGLIASLKKENIKVPISKSDFFLVKNSIRGIPNYDKGLWNKDQIVEYRNRLINRARELGIRMPHKKALSIVKSGI